MAASYGLFVSVPGLYAHKAQFPSTDTHAFLRFNFLLLKRTYRNFFIHHNDFFLDSEALAPNVLALAYAEKGRVP
jgi:hypothetical protein